MEKVQLGTLVKITSGFAFKSNLFNTDKSGLPLIRIRDVVRGYSDTYYEGEYKTEYLIQNDDALIGMDGEFNLALWKGGKALLNQRVCKIQSIDERLDQDYLIHFLPRALKDIEDRTPFVTVKHLSVKDINNILIPLPPLAEQRRIASILDQADELRQKRQQAIKKLDQLLQATFIDMFGDPVSNPKGWVSSTLGEQCEVGTGSTPSRQNADYFEGNIPWVKSTEVDWGTITYTSETISEDGKNSARLKMYPKGSIVLALYGQGITRGKSALLGIEATLNQACAALIAKESISNYFVFSFLRFSYENLRNQARGGNQENLNLSIVKSFPIYLPPKELQEKWSKIAVSIEDQKQKLYKQLDMQNQLFSSLQNQAFNGTL